MAKITMDASEYEAMKKTEKLLEAALSREVELNDKLHKLEEEKIKAYEDAKMKVVKIIKHETTEHKLKKVADPRPVLVELFHMVDGYRRGESSPNHYAMPHEYVWHIIDKLFYEATTINVDSTETTLHGLDEVKAEIKQQLSDEMSDDIKRKLTEANETSGRYFTIYEQHKDLTKENKIISEAKAKLVNKLDSALKTKAKYYDKVKAFNRIIETISTASMFNARKVLNKIINIIDSVE